jgi:hypothetical protein
MKEFDDEVTHCFSTCDPNGNLEVKVGFLKAKQGYKPRKIEKDKWNTVYYKSRYEIQEQKQFRHIQHHFEHIFKPL